MDVGKKVELCREQLGLNQTELGDLVGATQNTIFKIENGITQTSRYFPKLAKLFGMTMEEFLSDDYVPPPPEISPARAKLIRKVMGADEQLVDDIDTAIDAAITVASLKKKAADILSQ